MIKFNFLLLLAVLFACSNCAQNNIPAVSEIKPTPTPSLNDRPTLNTNDTVAKAEGMCKNHGRCREALAVYDEYLEKDKTRADVYEKRGMAYYALKQIEPAILDFDRAIKLSKENQPNLYFIRGLSKSLLEKEDREGACDDLRRAISLGWKSDDKSFDSWFAEYCPIN